RVTRSEPRRSLEDPGYLGMSLVHQRNMKSGWHVGVTSGQRESVADLSLFYRSLFGKFFTTLRWFIRRALRLNNFFLFGPFQESVKCGAQGLSPVCQPVFHLGWYLRID